MLNIITNSCMTYGDYASCELDPTAAHKSRLRVLVHDLEEGESREYGCTAHTVSVQGDPVLKNWKIVLTRIKTSTTSTTTTTTTTATTLKSDEPKVKIRDDGRTPVASEVQGTLHEFYVPPIVLIIGLCLIVFLALLSLVLIILQCRRTGRRKRRNRAANRESLLSAKSDIAGCSSSTKDLDLGVTTYRATRSFPSFAPGPPQAVPQPPGHPVAMRYQKGTPDDTGYVSGSSNHYSEPYGCHEEPGTQERTRSAPRPSMPQIKGSPQPPRLPDNHP